jgi:hypothetical protein
MSAVNCSAAQLRSAALHLQSLAFPQAPARADISRLHSSERIQQYCDELRREDEAMNDSAQMRAFRVNGLQKRLTRSPRSAKCNQTYDGSRETRAATVPVETRLRISVPMQLWIIKLFMPDHSLCEISRITGRARQTVTKVVRAPGIQARREELKAKLLGVVFSQT